MLFIQTQNVSLPMMIWGTPIYIAYKVDKIVEYRRPALSSRQGHKMPDGPGSGFLLLSLLL